MKTMFNKKVICLVIMMVMLSVGTASAFEVTPMSYVYFRMGHVVLSDAGDGAFYLGGETTAKETVSIISIDLYLEQYVNGSWVSVYHYSKTGFNKSSVFGSITKYVSRGTYRLRGVHTVKHNGIVESATSYTGVVTY